MEVKSWSISDVVKKTGIEPHVLRYWEKELNLNIPRNEFGYRYYLKEHIDLFEKIHDMKEGGYQLKAIKLLIPKQYIYSKDSELNTLETSSTATEDSIDKNKFSEEKSNSKVILIRRKGEISKRNTDIDKNMSDHNNEEYKNITLINNEAGSEDILTYNNMNDIDNNFKKSEKTDECDKCESSHTENSNNIISINKTEELNDYKLKQFKSILSDVMLDVLKQRDEKMQDEISNKVIKQMDYLMRLQDQFEEERFKHLDERIRMYQKEREMSGKKTFKERIRGRKKAGQK